MGIIIGYFIVRFFMPHAFGVNRTSAHYDYLGEGVANIVMKTKDQFLGDPRFPSENYVVRFNNPNLYLDHVVGHYDIQTLNNQTSIRTVAYTNVSVNIHQKLVKTMSCYKN